MALLNNRDYETGTDPVGYDILFDEWGFWDETFSFWTGGYETEAAARMGLSKYCLDVLGWND